MSEPTMMFLSNEAIARVCHEANRAYCVSIGDNSQDSWDAAPDWQKESAIAGVKFVQANPNAGDAAQHESWLEKKRADGWVYGEVKDADKKTHPCMVPFSDLPRFQQIKDKLFRSIVLALSAT